MNKKFETLMALRDTYLQLLLELPASIDTKDYLEEDKLTIIIAKGKIGNWFNFSTILYDSNEDGIFEDTNKFQQFLLDQIELHITDRNKYDLEEINKIRANI